MLIRTLVVTFELFPAGTGLKIACLSSKTSRSNLTNLITLLTTVAESVPPRPSRLDVGNVRHLLIIPCSFLLNITPNPGTAHRSYKETHTPIQYCEATQTI